jgi:glycosyltransferase involved in cell wall biosynthesis
MKVLQVVPALSAGGAEGFVSNLSVELASHGVEVRVFVLAGVRKDRGLFLLERLRDAGVEVIGIEERSPSSFSNLAALGRLIVSWKPDVVHAHLYASCVACALVKLLTADFKKVYARTLHSTEICNFRSPFLVRMLDRFFDLTVACSEPVAKSYAKFMRGKVRTKLVTVPNGANMSASVPSDEDKRVARAALGIPDNAFVACHIGRILGGVVGAGLESEPKAQDVLLKAFSEAFGDDPDCAQLLVGDGKLRPLAERLARDLGLEGRARFLGEQPEPWTALRASDAFFFPSRYEGLPLVLLEAASCGLPVVASDIPEIRGLDVAGTWILRPVDDVSGFAEAFREVRANKGAFAAKAREIAGVFRENYSMGACAGKFLQVFDASRRKNAGFVSGGGKD